MILLSKVNIQRQLLILIFAALASIPSVAFARPPTAEVCVKRSAPARNPWCQTLAAKDAHIRELRNELAVKDLLIDELNEDLEDALELVETLGSQARIPQSGQDKCWDMQANEISCVGTGQDGDIQAGVPWEASSRFTDNGDGTVKDNLTNLVWLADASCNDLGVRGDGRGDWQQALDAANSLGGGICGLSDGSSPGEWHLPAVKELQSLVMHGEWRPALPLGHPFKDVQFLYWSSATYSQKAAIGAWFVGLDDGDTNANNKATLHYIWPVRHGF